jgi:hypothetical protein
MKKKFIDGKKREYVGGKFDKMKLFISNDDLLALVFDTFAIITHTHIHVSDILKLTL